MVSIDSQEYPTDFLVLHLKTNFNGYSVVLGGPLLASIDAYINCRVVNMTITNGQLRKQLVLDIIAQPIVEHDFPMWVEEE